MTVILQRMVRCAKCDRPTGTTFDQPIDVPPYDMPRALCSNCDLSVLPAPWNRDRDYIEDEEPETEPAPRCVNCDHDLFSFRIDEVDYVFVSERYWCEGCGQWEDLRSVVPLAERQVDQIAPREIRCANCGDPAHESWEW